MSDLNKEEKLIQDIATAAIIVGERMTEKIEDNGEAYSIALSGAAFALSRLIHFGSKTFYKTEEELTRVALAGVINNLNKRRELDPQPPSNLN